MAGPVHAQGGINLSWDDCGSAGQPLATFACNVNTTIDRLYASFVSPLPLSQLVGVEVTIDAAFDQATVPSWWQMQSSGGCRQGSLNATADFTSGPFSCADPWGGSAVALVVIAPGVPTVNRARINAVAALPPGSSVAVNDVSEYHALALTLNHQKSVGAGSCAGCQVSACLAITSIKLVQPVGVGDHTLAQPLSNPIVGWQCPAFYGTPGPACHQCPVRSKRGTWGTVKGMYR